MNGDGTWRRNPLGLSTSCVVIRPATEAYYRYVTEDPESAKDLWKMEVGAGRTEAGLKEWFDANIRGGDMWDDSFVHGLLSDVDNPTVKAWLAGNGGETFRGHVEQAIIGSSTCPGIASAEDIREWEGSGYFPPDRPFAIEFAPRGLVEEYYGHLRETGKWKSR